MPVMVFLNFIQSLLLLGLNSSGVGKRRTGSRTAV